MRRANVVAVPASFHLRTARAGACLGVVLFVAASGASAALPAVLEAVPDGAPGVVAVGSIKAFDNRLGQLLGSMEQPAISLSGALTAMGLGDGLDPAGGAAIAWMNPPGAPPGGEADAAPDHAPDVERHIVVFLPVKDEKAFLTAIHAAGNDPVRAFDYNGRSYFARPVATHFVALSASKPLIEGLKPGKGWAQALTPALGADGLKAVDDAGMIVTGDPAGAAQAVDFMAGMIGAQASPFGGPQFKTDRIKSIISQCSGGVLAITPGALGLRMDAFVGFKEASDAAKLCAAAAPAEHAAPLMSSLPAGDFIFAFGADTTHPFVRTMLAESPAAEGEKDPAEHPSRLDHLRAALRHSLTTALPTMKDFNFGVYTPAGPMMSVGALSSVIATWHSDKPQNQIDAFGSALKAYGAATDTGKDKTSVSFDAAKDVATSDGALVQTWSMLPPLKANGSPPGPIYVPLFGSKPGLQGLAATRADTGWITLGRDPALLDGAMNKKERLLDDPTVSKLAAMMPSSSAFVAFFQPKSIINQFGGMAAMATGQAISVPDDLPPIAMGVSMREGRLHAAGFVPAQALKAAAAASQAVAGAAGGGPGDGDEHGATDRKPEPAKKPKESPASEPKKQ